MLKNQVIIRVKVIFRLLQPRVFLTFILHTLAKSLNRHFCETHRQHLLGRQRLPLLQLLLLIFSLDVILAHNSGQSYDISLKYPIHLAKF